MTDTDKAWEIAETFINELGWNLRVTEVACVAFSMAFWKDEQLKQILDERIEHSTGERHEAFMDLYRQLFEQNGN